MKKRTKEYWEGLIAVLALHLILPLILSRAVFHLHDGRLALVMPIWAVATSPISLWFIRRAQASRLPKHPPVPPDPSH